MQLALRFIGEPSWLLMWLLQTSLGPVLSGCELKIDDSLWVGKAQALGCFCCSFQVGLFVCACEWVLVYSVEPSNSDFALLTVGFYLQPSPAALQPP